MGFAAGYGVDLDGVDDVGEGDDEIGGVFLWGFFLMSGRFFRTGAGREKGGVGFFYLVVFVKGEILRPENDPESLPLSDPAFRFQAEEVAVPYDPLVIVLVGVKATRLAHIPGR